MLPQAAQERYQWIVLRRFEQRRDVHVLDLDQAEEEYPYREQVRPLNEREERINCHKGAEFECVFVPRPTRKIGREQNAMRL